MESKSLHGLDLPDDFVGKLGALGGAAQVPGDHIALLYHLKYTGMRIRNFIPRIRKKSDPYPTLIRQRK